MQLNINLATRSYINTRHVNLTIAVAILLLLLWLSFNIKEIAFNAGESRRLETQVAALEKKLQGETKGVPVKQYDALLKKIHFANSVIDRKNFDWLGFLNQLESVVPERITLATVEPDVQKQSLKLTGYARDFADLRHFFEVLSSSSYFRNIFLENQSAVKVGQNQKGVSFTITCTVIYR
ncbi:PilN domain-containing protein [Geotalea sp. SG265]|uniref:PilN domain-containing protein n=1 Tax=Geotalea sp. SG265 TaxID=2922867 RepID=UPI001FAF78CA|nr:PilN domain-containing protein [Geotalea sp. SG265]